MDDFSNRPFDLSNPHELRVALEQTTVTYFDYFAYWMRLENLMEDVDETIEDSDFSTWMRMCCDPDSVDDLTTDATASLRNTTDIFTQLANRARKNLVFIIKAVLAAPADFQMMVWGKAYDIPAQKADEILEELFDEIAQSFSWEEQEDDPFEGFLAILGESFSLADS